MTHAEVTASVVFGLMGEEGRGNENVPKHTHSHIIIIKHHITCILYRESTNELIMPTCQRIDLLEPGLEVNWVSSWCFELCADFATCPSLISHPTGLVQTRRRSRLSSASQEVWKVKVQVTNNCCWQGNSLVAKLERPSNAFCVH